MTRQDKPRVLAIVLARGGSKSVPRKNIRPILGQPLIAYTLCEARRSQRISRLIVSTDDLEIQGIAKRYGAESPFLRPAELSTDKATSKDALKHAVSWAEQEEGRPYDYVIELMCTNPMKTSGDIDAVLQKLITTGADSVIGVCKVEDKHPIRMKRIENERLVDFALPEIPDSRRQDLKPDAYVRNGAIYAMRRDVLMVQNARYGTNNSLPYVMTEEQSVNVDTEVDWLMAEQLLKQRDLSHVKPVNAATLRMGSWHQEQFVHLELPSHWPVTRCELSPQPVLSDSVIREAIENPVDGPTLREAAKGAKRVCIVVDDLTRPTKAYRAAPAIIDELHKAGVRDEAIFFLVSLGTHRPLTLEEQKKKIGREIAERFPVYNHNAYQNIVVIGRTSAGTPVTINKYYHEADFRIAIGGSSPHPYAGFSGGGKILMPGLAGFESVVTNHKPVNESLAGAIGKVEGNTRRADIQEAARMIGLNFLVTMLENAEGQTAGVVAGTPEPVFERASELGQQFYATRVVYGADIGIFNAYPKDSWFLLSLNALDVWSLRDGSHDLVREGGVIVIVNQCSEGLGTHGLYEKGFIHHVRRDKHGTFGSMIRTRKLVFYSPNMQQAWLRDHYADDVVGFRRWEDVLSHVQQVCPNPRLVSVYPTASQQFDEAALAVTTNR